MKQRAASSNGPSQERLASQVPRSASLTWYHNSSSSRELEHGASLPCWPSLTLALPPLAWRAWRGKGQTQRSDGVLWWVTSRRSPHHATNGGHVGGGPVTVLAAAAAAEESTVVVVVFVPPPAATTTVTTTTTVAIVAWVIQQEKSPFQNNNNSMTLMRIY